MIWYCDLVKGYEYPSKKNIDTLAPVLYDFNINRPEQTGLAYSLSYMVQNSINNLTIVLPIEKCLVGCGKDRDINIEYCQKNNISYRFDDRPGGCMVLFPGNVLVQSIGPKQDLSIGLRFLIDFTNWLQNKSISDVIIDGNDIMVEGKKIVGISNYPLPQPYNKWNYFGIQISININKDLIDNICTKTGVKQPNALSKYGISTQEVIDWLLNWFYQYE